MIIAAIIQARMGSSRLPGKSLVDISGQPLLKHIVDRAKAAKTVSLVMVATTVDPSDDQIEDACKSWNVPVYRGSGEDVLDRYYEAAKSCSAEVVVRITADDPFKDPEVIDLIVSSLLEKPAADYASNTMEPTYPEGLDVEAMTFKALERAWSEAKLGSEREHVTPYIWKHPDCFTLVSVKQDQDESKMRWTLDYPEDLEFARAVYQELYKGQVFCADKIRSLLTRSPRLAALNQGFVRNAGYIKSIQSENHEKQT